MPVSETECQATAWGKLGKNYPVVDQGETGSHAIFANPNHNSNPFLWP